MLVLGLDPGIAKFGYGYVEHEHGKIHFIDAGVVKTPASETLALRLATIQESLSVLLTRRLPDRVVIERLVPAPGRSLIGVAEARGVALALIGQHKLPVSEESPKAVKMLATRYGGATKMQMRLTIQKLLYMEDLPPADAADALALAALGRPPLDGYRSV